MSPRQYLALAERFRSRERRKDGRTALLAAMIANTVPRKRGRRAARPEDFMPREKRSQSPDQMLRIVEMLNVLHEGEDLRDGSRG